MVFKFPCLRRPILYVSLVWNALTVSVGLHGDDLLPPKDIHSVGRTRISDDPDMREKIQSFDFIHDLMALPCSVSAVLPSRGDAMGAMCPSCCPMTYVMLSGLTDYGQSTCQFTVWRPHARSTGRSGMPLTLYLSTHALMESTNNSSDPEVQMICSTGASFHHSAGARSASA